MIDGIARWWRERISHPAQGASDTSASRPPVLPPIPDDLLRAAKKATIERLRSPMREADLSLAMETRLWMLRLPGALQPRHLSREHPRVANHLARAWDDLETRDAMFEDLLHDRRGDRRGFAKTVATELRRLRHFSLRQRQHLEARRQMPDFDRGDTLPMALMDNTGGIDWTPTETIVVRDERSS